MKILLATYSAETHTSYGIVTRELWKRLKNLNPEWQIMQQGWFHKSLEPVPWHIEPTMTTTNAEGQTGVHRGDIYGKMSFENVVAKFRPDLVWTLADPYMCDYMGQYRGRYGFKLLKYCPVDGVPQPASWREALKDCDMFVPITKFGADALAPSFKGEVKQHIYHGVDTDRFKPFSADARARLRPHNLGEDAKILGFVGHNQFRKMNWVMFPILKYLRTGAYYNCLRCDKITLQQWDPVTKKMSEDPLPRCDHCGDETSMIPGDPRNVHLWMHCFNRQGVTWQPEKMKDLWGLEGAVMFTQEMTADVGVPEKDMPSLFNCFDVYLALSGGEGFCIPMVEAMACGVPVVYTDYSGHGEVARGIGKPVRPAVIMPDQVEPIGRAIADIADAVRVIGQLLDNKDVRLQAVSAGLSAARDRYSWDLIATQWNDLLHNNFSPKRVATVGVSL
jgi:glycosyltransferase involved in cell wall biosynthesis